MNVYKIAVIAGDGIGPEVIAEGVKVIEEVARLDGGFKFEFTYFPLGCEFYKETGKKMDDDGIEKLKAFVSMNTKKFEEGSVRVVAHRGLSGIERENI